MPKTDLEFMGRDHPAAGVWRLHLPYATNPLPMNGGRGNPKAHGRMVRRVREEVVWRARAARIPRMDRVSVHLVWWVASRHVRDTDNLGELEKVIFDALATRRADLPSARIVSDDSPEFMDKPRAQIRHLSLATPADQVTGPGFVITITRLQATA